MVPDGDALGGESRVPGVKSRLPSRRRCLAHSPFTSTVDLLMLLGMWGACVDCDACAADLDGDCIVGTIDLLMMLGAWRG